MFIAKRTMILLLGLTLVNLFALAHAADKGAQSTVKPENTPVYKPPKRGAPLTRIGGGTRGSGEALILTVLAPEHTGLAATDQPTLYWYVGQPFKTRVELAVADDRSVEPLLETDIETSLNLGVQHLRLADHGVRLEPGTEYQWSVAIINDPKQRANDIVSSGTIKYVKAPVHVQEKLEQATQEESVAIYAGQGYWYDAMQSLSELIEARSQNNRFREQRAALLEQVALPEAAAYDRQR